MISSQHFPSQRSFQTVECRLLAKLKVYPAMRMKTNECRFLSLEEMSETG
jgi:hypothetical protein